MMPGNGIFGVRIEVPAWYEWVSQVFHRGSAAVLHPAPTSDTGDRLLGCTVATTGHCQIHHYRRSVLCHHNWSL